MAKRYQKFSLRGASESPRAHPHEVQLPQMISIENMFLSPSDHVPTLRSDFRPYVWPTKVWTENAAAATEDGLNSIVLSQPRGHRVHITRNMVHYNPSGTPVDLMGTYTEGTATANNGSTTMTGSATFWMTNAWGGCWVFFSGDTNLYRVERVKGDAEIILRDTKVGTSTGVSYTIYQTHHPDNAAWPVNIQRFADALIYNAVNPKSDIDMEAITGPFASRTGTAFVEYGTANPQAYTGPIIYGNGSIIATANNQVSVDHGATWATTGKTGPYTFSGGYFWVGGLDIVEYSSDGITWTTLNVRDSAASPFGETYDAVADNGGRIVAHYNGGYAYSDDRGVVWVEVTAQEIWDLKILNSAYSLFGHTGTYFYSVMDDSYAPNIGYILTSTDGVTWTKRRIVDGQIKWVDLNSGQPAVASWYNKITLFDANFGNPDEYLIHGSSSIEYVFWTGARWLAAAEGVFPQGGVYFGNSLSAMEQIVFTPQQDYSCSSVVESNGTIVFQGIVGAVVQVAQITVTPVDPEDKVDIFRALSPTLRGKAFAVQGSQVCLYNVREYDSQLGIWNWHPRRMWYSAPGSYNQFGGTGSGWQDLPGDGAILDAVPLGTNAVLNETNQISLVYDKGSLTDQWGYRKLDQKSRSISNLLSKGSLVWYVSDQGILKSTNGVQTEETNFDLTEHIDFEHTDPVHLSFAPWDAILLYVPQAGGDHHVFFFSPDTGSITHFDIPQHAGDIATGVPQFAFTALDPEDPSFYISYNAFTSFPDEMAVLELDPDYNTGIDQFQHGEQHHWTAHLQTGEIRLTRPGLRFMLHELNLRTFTDTGSHPPLLSWEWRTTKDSKWYHPAIDQAGSITATPTAVNGVGTAFDAGLTGGTRIAKGDGITTTYDLPCWFEQARVYRYAAATFTPETGYTKTGPKQLDLSSALLVTEELWVFWDALPFVTGATNDFIVTSEGWHQVQTVIDAYELTPYWFPSTSLSGEARLSEPIQQGEEGLSILGVGAKFDGMTLRLHVLPQSYSGSQPKIVKVMEIETVATPMAREAHTDTRGGG